MGASCVDGSPNGETVQPGIESLRFAKSGQVPPGSHQCLLDSVSCELRVPEDETGNSVESDKSVAGEHGKGVMIASPRSHDQLLLLHDRLWW